MKKVSPVFIQRVPLEDFISVLMEVYGTGADYIDIIGNMDGIQDMITIAVRDEYMNTGPREGDKLSEDELNQLLQ